MGLAVFLLMLALGISIAIIALVVGMIYAAIGWKGTAILIVLLIILKKIT